MCVRHIVIASTVLLAVKLPELASNLGGAEVELSDYYCISSIRRRGYAARFCAATIYSRAAYFFKLADIR